MVQLAEFKTVQGEYPGLCGRCTGTAAGGYEGQGAVCGYRRKSICTGITATPVFNGGWFLASENTTPSIDRLTGQVPGMYQSWPALNGDDNLSPVTAAEIFWAIDYITILEISITHRGELQVGLPAKRSPGYGSRFSNGL